jgi:HSP20 family protein
MDRLFEEGFSRPWRFLRGVEETAGFPVEISETEGEIDVKASLPGVKPDEIDVTIHDDMLMIKTEIRKELEDQGKNYYRQELRYGVMQRAITLPVRIEADRAEASYQDGILYVKLPKSPEAQGMQIKVRAGAPTPSLESRTGPTPETRPTSPEGMTGQPQTDRPPGGSP